MNPLLVQGLTTIQPIVDGNVVECDSPPIIINNRVLVPARALSEALGCKVVWDEQTNSVLVTSSTFTNNNAAKISNNQATNSTKLTLVKERFAIKLGQDLYWLSPEFVYQDDNNYYFDLPSILKIIGAYYNDYIVEPEVGNPYVKGSIAVKNSDDYLTIERKYVNATQSYVLGSLHNKNKSKVYSFNSKPGEETGVFTQHDRLFFLLESVLGTFNIQYSIAKDNANGIYVITF